MNRREFINRAGFVGIISSFSGCTFGTGFNSDGEIIDEIEIINIDEEYHRFEVSLENSATTSVYHESIIVPGAPDTKYELRKLTDIPKVEATHAVAAIETSKIRERIPKPNGTSLRLSIMCSNTGKLGITVFT